MRFKILVLYFLLLLVYNVVGQTPCDNYGCVINKVKEALDTKDYDAAFNNLESAAAYPGRDPEEIGQLRKKLFESINRDKIRADQRAEEESRAARRSELSVRQLRDLNTILLDTILSYEENRIKLQNEMIEYKNTLEAQKKELEVKNEQMAAQARQLDDITAQLEKSLEQHYLRQNKHYTDISSNLKAWLRYAKGIRDHLPYIPTYFSNGNFESLVEDISGYHKAFEKLDNHYPAYLEAVEHHWENNDLLKEMETLFDFLVQSIHYDQIQGMTTEMMAAIDGKKPKKARKMAALAYEELSVNLATLEKDLDAFLSELRKNF